MIYMCSFCNEIAGPRNELLTQSSSQDFSGSRCVQEFRFFSKSDGFANGIWKLSSDSCLLGRWGLSNQSRQWFSDEALHIRTNALWTNGQEICFRNDELKFMNSPRLISLVMSVIFKQRGAHTSAAGKREISIPEKLSADRAIAFRISQTNNHLSLSVRFSSEHGSVIIWIPKHDKQRSSRDKSFFFWIFRGSSSHLNSIFVLCSLRKPKYCWQSWQVLRTAKIKKRLFAICLLLTTTNYRTRRWVTSRLTSGRVWIVTFFSLILTVTSVVSGAKWSRALP